MSLSTFSPIPVLSMATRRRRNRHSASSHSVVEYVEPRQLLSASSAALSPVETDAGIDSRQNESTHLLSFKEPGTVLDPATDRLVSFDDSDILAITAKDTGEYRTEIYFDGSRVGLDSNTEDIDAFSVLPDGDILVSTSGTVQVPGIPFARANDILRFRPATSGDLSQGTWDLLLDGSQVGLFDQSDNNIDAISVLDNGAIVLSISGSSNVAGTFVNDEDLLTFTPSNSGDYSRGTWSKYFDGSDNGLHSPSNDIDAAFVVDEFGSSAVLLSVDGITSVGGVTARDSDVLDIPLDSAGRTSLAFDADDFGTSAFRIDGYHVIQPEVEEPPFTIVDDIAVFHATPDIDVLEFRYELQNYVTFNGTEYAFLPHEVAKFVFNGDGGRDHVVILGGNELDSAELQPNSGTARNESGTWNVEIEEVFSVHFYGNNGGDSVRIEDSPSSDTLHLSPNSADFTGEDFDLLVVDVTNIEAVSEGGGTDTAHFVDSDFDDEFVFSAESRTATLEGRGFKNSASGFYRHLVHATAGGNDTATLYDSSGDDRFYSEAENTRAAFVSPNSVTKLFGFETNMAVAIEGGYDVALMWDSSRPDHLIARPTSLQLVSPNAEFIAQDFERFRIVYHGDGDRATWLNSRDQQISRSEYQQIIDFVFTLKRRKWTGF